MSHFAALPGLRLAAILGTLIAAATAAIAAELPLYGGQVLTVDLPKGWTLESGANPEGLITARVASRDAQVSLQITFFPDAEGRLGREADQRKIVEEIAARYVPDSVEQEVRLVPLRSRHGAGFYCVFTDAKLVGQVELPPSEYRHATTGLRASAGWFGLFTLFSQNTDSPDYRAGLDLLRHSLGRAGPAVRRPRNPDAF